MFCGYFIPKKSVSTTMICDKLTVCPRADTTFSDEKPVPFPVYRDTKTHWIVPYHWAQKKNYIYKQPPRPEPNPIHIHFLGTLYPFQQRVIDTVLPVMREKGGGVLQLVCGMGKTICALYIAAQLGVKTLVLVHKEFLVDQWKERIHQMWGPDIHVGRMQQKTVDISAPIVIGMVQSIARDISGRFPSSVFDSFGLVIVDEVHHFPSQVFSNVFWKCAPKYTLGLSATPQRSDGLSRVFHWFLGNMFNIDKSIQQRDVIPTVTQYMLSYPAYIINKRTVCKKNASFHLPLMLSRICEDINRSRRIVRRIVRCITEEEGRNIIVFSARRAHIQTLKRIFDEKLPTIPTGFYVGKMKKEELEHTAETARVIFSTFCMASDALDIPRLNTVVLTTPKSNVEQSVGRILRKKADDAGPRPLVIDYVDCYDPFILFGDRHIRYYKSLGYPVEQKWHPKKVDVASSSSVCSSSVCSSSAPSIKASDMKKKLVMNQQQLDTFFQRCDDEEDDTPRVSGHTR